MSDVFRLELPPAGVYPIPMDGSFVKVPGIGTVMYAKESNTVWIIMGAKVSADVLYERAEDTVK